MNAFAMSLNMSTVLELLVPLLAFLSVVMTGGAIVSAYSPERRAVRRRLRAIGGSEEGVPDKGLRSGALQALGGFGRILSRRSPSSSLKQQLANAGYHGSSAPAVYLGAKQVLLLIGLFGATPLLVPMEMPVHLKVLASVAAGAVLYLLPNMAVLMRRRQRTKEARHHLPDAVDLLEICVAAGMGLDMAWNSVADEVRKVSPTLGDEMALTNLEMHLGAPRAEAMRHMAERTGVTELGSLVSLLVQSDRFGTSVSDALKTFAHTMREERSLKAQEAGEKMAVKLLLPMVLFIFPAVLIVLVGPAAIRLFRMITTH